MSKSCRKNYNHRARPRAPGTTLDFNAVMKDYLKAPYERIICRTGSVSIQAGPAIYSTPRTLHGPYTHAEAGFPVGVVPVSWKPFKRNDTVYAYLPFKLVWQFIKLNGGFIAGELPHHVLL